MSKEVFTLYCINKWDCIEIQNPIITLETSAENKDIYVVENICERLLEENKHWLRIDDNHIKIINMPYNINPNTYTDWMKRWFNEPTKILIEIKIICL